MTILDIGERLAGTGGILCVALVILGHVLPDSGGRRGLVIGILLVAGLTIAALATFAGLLIMVWNS